MKKYRFLADENIPFEVVEKLYEKKIDIKSVSLLNPGADDIEVLGMARRQNRILLTFDKDFGELVFKLKIKSSGVILLRIHPYSIDGILTIIHKAFLKIAATKIDLSLAFCVVEERRMSVIFLKV